MKEIVEVISLADHEGNRRCGGKEKQNEEEK